MASKQQPQEESKLRRAVRIAIPVGVVAGTLAYKHVTRPETPGRILAPKGYEKPKAKIRIQPKKKPAPAVVEKVWKKAFETHGKVVEFNYQNQEYSNRFGAATGVLTAYRKGRRAVPWIKRGSQAVNDTIDISAGKEVKDPFYKKGWFKSAATGAAIAAPILISRKAHKWHHQDQKYPGSLGTGLKGDVRKAVVKAARGIDKAYTKKYPKREPLLTGERAFFEAKSGTLITFDFESGAKGWDIRDPRGRSARVYAPGSRKRVRREKEWSEKTENIRAVRNAALAGAAGLGVLALRYRSRAKTAEAKSATPKRRGKVVKVAKGNVIAANFAAGDDHLVKRLVRVSGQHVNSKPDLPGEDMVDALKRMPPKRRASFLRLMGAGTLAVGGVGVGRLQKRPVAGALTGGVLAGLVARG